MEDPTTLAINLTYLGTLGLAVLMFLGLGLVIIITLVVAGVGRLLSIVLLAMVGIFPKKETTPIVKLPPRPARVPDPVTGVESPAAVESPLDDLAYLETGSTAAQAPTAVATASQPAASAPVSKVAAAPSAPARPDAPKRDLLGDVRRRLSGASAAVKDGAWKAKVDPRNLPKPAEVKSVVENQAAHHPILVAATKEPPVLAKDWADAVAEADRRAAARAQAEQPPAIKVTVRDVGEPTPSSSNGTTPSPKTPDTSAKTTGNGNGKTGSGNDGSGPTGNGSGGGGNGGGDGAKKSGPNTSKNGKSPSPIRKGSLSSASRNS
ncbi:putative membrane protein YgcG [Arthrobacter bambusae]|uniref:Membrane protein YgcG n=1 Tax=Arthrobacter bambusae TaxID=1338426 RepID=A0ABV2PCM1_9MICC